MNHLETEYLKRNHFHPGTEGRIVANVIQDFRFVEDGFCDKRQLDLIRAQFGDDLKNVSEMNIIIGSGYADLHWWTIDKDTGKSFPHVSDIGGNGMYELISRAIVLAFP